MPAPSTVPARGHAPTDDSSPDLRLAVVATGAVLAGAAGWAAAHSDTAGSGAGEVLGRLDGGLAVLLLVVAAALQADVTGRALAGREVPAALGRARLLLRGLLVPWWLAVTVALFGYPTAPGAITPTDAAAPTWVEVVREWLLVSPYTRGAGVDGWAPASAGRMGQVWVVATLALVVALVPAWERLLHHLGTRGRDPIATVVTLGSVLAVTGLVLRVAVATRDPGGWATVARIVPPAQLDLIGAGLVLGALGAAARAGRGPLAGWGPVLRRAAPRLGGVAALALVAGAAGPGAASTLEPGGPVATGLARVGLALVGGAGVLWALPGAGDGSAGEDAPSWVASRGRWRPAGWWVPVGALVSFPLVAQLWATRAGGGPGRQGLGPLVVVTVLGALAAGGLLAGAGRAGFGPDRRRRLSPFGARLAVVTGSALAWRLLTLVSINVRNPDGGDPFYYHHQANMLADRVGYSEPFRWIEAGVAVPSAIHPPLLSTWLAAGSVLGARTFLAHKAMTALLAVAVVVVAALIARRLAGDRAGLVTAVLVAAYPNLWVIDGALWPEGVYTTMVALAVLAAYRWWEAPDLRRATVLGAVIAVAALARGEALFLYPILVAPLVLRRRGLGWGHRVRSGLVAGLCGLVLLAPWTIRNLRAFDDLVLLSTNSDEVLYYANCPDSYGLDDPRARPGEGPAASDEFLGYWSFNCQQRERARAGRPVTSQEADRYRGCLERAGHPEAWAGVVPGEPPGDEVEKARYWRCLGTHYAADHLDRLPVVAAARVGRELDLYRPDQGLLLLEVEGRPRAAARLGQVTWWAMAPVGVAGWLLLRRRRVLVYPLVSLGVMVLATTLYAYGAVRFRTPLELGLLIGAGVLGERVLARVVRRSGPRPDRPVPSGGAS